MFFPVILVCASIIVPVGPARQGPVGAVPFSTNDVVDQMTHRRERTALGSSILGHWEGPAAALLQEFMIDTSITYVAAFGRQCYPSAASDGSDYLVVWQDGRYGIGSDIYGARVGASGNVLDPEGIKIASTGHSQVTPSLAFDGTNYFVVWADCRGLDCDIYGARVDVSGTVLDTSGIPICTVPYDQWYPSVAFSGFEYFVVWNDSRDSGIQIYGARVSPSGAVLDSLGTRISVTALDALDPCVVSDGNKFLVAWVHCLVGDGDDIYGARVDASGLVLDTLGIAISTAVRDQVYPSVSFDGTNYLVVWDDMRGPSYLDVYGARVDTSGYVLDTSGIGIATADGWQHHSSVAFGSTNYVVVWRDNRFGHGIYCARVDTSGIVIDSAGIAVSVPLREHLTPRVTFGGSDYFAVWSELRWTSDLNIYGARVDTSGAVLDSLGIEISTSGNWQHNPRGAFDGTRYFIAWDDTRTGVDHDVRGARLTPSGTRLDDTGMLIGTADDWQWFPTVSFGRKEYLVVWEDWRGGQPECDLYGTPVDTSGFVLDTSGLPISTVPYCQRLPSGAFDGANHLVVWVDERSYPEWNIYGTRVDTLASVLDSSGIAICTTSVRQRAPSVAYGGSNYLVVWEDSRDGVDTDIYGARVTESGAVLDSSGIAISIAPDEQCRPTVSSGCNIFFVVWEDSQSGGGWDIYGCRIDASGNVLDPSGITISGVTSSQSHPSVAFDGFDFLVAWQDYRSGIGWDIYGARVDTAGNVLDPLGLELVDEPYDRMRPTITVGDAGQLLLTFDGFSPSPYNSNRVFGAFYSGVGIEEEIRKSKVVTARLLQNRPNPFHARTTIQYQISAMGFVSLKVYDSSGRLVSVLVNEQKAAGSYTTTWDGKDTSGLQVSSGIYFYRLEAAGFTNVNKMIFLR